MVKGHTRITGRSATLTDLANKPENIVTSGIGRVGMTDHSLIYILRKNSISRKQQNIIVAKQYKNYRGN